MSSKVSAVKNQDIYNFKYTPSWFAHVKAVFEKDSALPKLGIRFSVFALSIVLANVPTFYYIFVSITTGTNALHFLHNHYFIFVFYLIAPAVFFYHVYSLVKLSASSEWLYHVLQADNVAFVEWLSMYVADKHYVLAIVESLHTKKCPHSDYTSIDKFSYSPGNNWDEFVFIFGGGFTVYLEVNSWFVEVEVDSLKPAP